VVALGSAPLVHGARAAERPGTGPRPVALLDLDAGRWIDRPRAEADRGGVNPRRARLGVEAALCDGLEAAFVWDFGGAPGAHSNLHEARLQWRAGEAGTLTAGVFQPRFSLADAASPADLLFLESPAIVGFAAGLAAGTRRAGIQGHRSGERWLASAAVTGDRVGEPDGAAQRGVLARLAGLPWRDDRSALHVGVSAAWSRRVADSPGLTPDPGPELELGRGDPPLDPGRIRSDRARTAGLELGLGRDRLWTQGERYVVALDGTAGGPARLDGGYAQIAWSVAGSPRRWSPEQAVWSVPGEARRGTVEAGLRWSRIDLDDAGVRGGRQRAVSVALAAWVGPRLRLSLQALRGRIDGAEGIGRFGAAALRVHVAL
jgi:phosphate-selective porin OprO/OprP